MFISCSQLRYVGVIRSKCSVERLNARILSKTLGTLDIELLRHQDQIPLNRRILVKPSEDLTDCITGSVCFVFLKLLALNFHRLDI